MVRLAAVPAYRGAPPTRGLTGDGRELLRRYRSRVAALEERMLSGLTAEQAAELRRGLGLCRANLAGR